MADRMMSKTARAIPKYMLMEIFRQHNDQIRALVGREYAAGTLDRYETSYKHTLNFLQWKYQITDMDITRLNYEFMAEYEFWLKSVRKCDHNSTMKYLANFKKIVIRCIKNGWLKQDPFIGFKLTKREVERIALTQSEIDRIGSEIFPMEGTSIVRDIFLFSCYTGLAYADVEKLKTIDIVTGNDGDKWLISRRQKTDITAKIPLLPAALNIIDKHANHPKCVAKNLVLPVLTNQKMNDYLKIIANQCNITKTLTFHIARHTFATTVTLSNGVPIETVSKMLGHRNLKTTQHYAKILDKKIGDDMKGLMEKYK
jgi:site-specific recombinase XerD